MSEAEESDIEWYARGGRIWALLSILDLTTQRDRMTEFCDEEKIRLSYLVKQTANTEARSAELNFVLSNRDPKICWLNRAPTEPCQPNLQYQAPVNPQYPQL